MKRKRNSSKVSIIKNMLIWKEIDRNEKSFEVMVLRNLTDLERSFEKYFRPAELLFTFFRLSLSVVGLFIDF